MKSVGPLLVALLCLSIAVYSGQIITNDTGEDEHGLRVVLSRPVDITALGNAFTTYDWSDVPYYESVFSGGPVAAWDSCWFNYDPAAAVVVQYEWLSTPPSVIESTQVEAVGLGRLARVEGMPPNRIFFNGVVVPMTEESERFQAIALVNDTILALGSNDEILCLAGPETELVDLDGTAVYPGFIDPHTHLFQRSVRDRGDEGFDWAQEHALRSGITLVTEMSTKPWLAEDLVPFAEQGNLRVRVRMNMNYVDSCGTLYGAWYETYPPDREIAPRLYAGGVKFFSELSVCNGDLWPVFSEGMMEYFTEEGRTRWPDNQLLFSADELAAAIRRCDEQGYQIFIHAMGDVGIETSLDAIELALDGKPNDLRHAILHNYYIRDDLLPRFVELGVVALVEPTSPCHTQHYAEYVGDENRRYFKRWQDLTGTGARVALNSDWPWLGYDSLNPMRKLHAITTQEEVLEVFDDWGSCEPQPFDQRVSVWQGLRMMTNEAAYAIRMEDELGTLEPGKLADLVVLSDDPLGVDPTALIDIEVRLTMVGGVVEYEHESLEKSATLSLEPDGGSSDTQISSDSASRIRSVELAEISWLASINQDRAAGTAENHANILVGSDELGEFYGMEWASPEPTDLTLMGFDSIPVSEVEEIVLTMSASKPMHLVIRLTVDGEYCTQTWQDARITQPIEVGTDVECYRFRLEDFATNMGNVCQESLHDDALDNVTSLVIWPSASSGELRIYSIEFCTQGGEPTGCLLAETATANALTDVSLEAQTATQEPAEGAQCEPCTVARDIYPSRWGPISMAYGDQDLESVWCDFPEIAAVNVLNNGSFEMPTITQAISEGAEGELAIAVWDVDVSQWEHSEELGFCRFMVADGKQCLFWDDPKNAWLAQTVSWEELGATTGDVVVMTFWCQVGQLDGAKAAGKTIEFVAELLSGDRVVDSLLLTASTDPALFRLSFEVTDESLGLPVTVRFRADGNCGWSGSEEVQSVFLDDVALGVESFQLPLRVRGVCSPDAEPLPGRNVIVEFPDPNYYMLFDPPYATYYYVVGSYGFANEWTETNINGECFEVSADWNARMWIERASPARVVIRFRGALVSPRTGEIAHTDRASGSPYGDGDWADEWYYVYPNGVSARHVLIYTGYARGASSFWWPGAPASFETQETFIHGLLPAHQPMDDIDIEAVTLAKLDESYERISFADYPREEDLFPGASIQIVNVLNPYKPFTIVPEGNTDIMPYWGTPNDQVNLYSTKLVAWPRVPVFAEGYMTAITHVINRSWYRQSETTLEQIYLLGLSATPAEADRVAELVQLARSWQYAPEAEAIGSGYSFDGYQAEEKAYHLSVESLGDDPLRIRFSASRESPLVDPCLVIHGWAKDVPFQVSIGDLTLEPSVNYYCGFEDQPEGSTALVVWIRATSLTSTEIRITAHP